MNASRGSITSAFGRLVRQRRTILSISQEELGLRAGLDRTYVSGLERGVRNPSLTAITSVAAGLGISTSDLLDRLEKEAENTDEQEQ